MSRRWWWFRWNGIEDEAVKIGKCKHQPFRFSISSLDFLSLHIAYDYIIFPIFIIEWIVEANQISLKINLGLAFNTCIHSDDSFIMQNENKLSVSHFNSSIIAFSIDFGLVISFCM